MKSQDKRMVSLLLVCLSLSLAGCGGGAPGTETVGPQQNAVFIEGVDHPYFPITPGTLRIYAGHHDGEPRREEVRTLGEGRVIMGVMCTGVRQEVYIDEALAEVTTEWYAQDHEGNVWKFGEESHEVEQGHLMPADDSWEAGRDGGEVWMAFPADPVPGTSFSGYTPLGPDQFHVLSTEERVQVPAGNFEGCMQVLENPDDPKDTDIILYARGVGRVQELNSSGQIELAFVGRE
jgi:hypothetical protein